MNANASTVPIDGVHKGHQIVLSTVVRKARDQSSEGAHAVGVTFEPDPVTALHPERARTITSPDHRLDLLSATGLDAVLVMEFTRDFARWTPERFVVEVLVKGLRAKLVVVGNDTRFGVNNSEGADTLRRLRAEHGFEVLMLDDLGEEGRWSSSRIRDLLSAGDVAGAAEILGRPHLVSGEVVHGDNRGRQLGYPTANLCRESEGLIPADGIYAGRLNRPTLRESHPDRALPAAISIGTNPTFAGTERRVEAHVLDRLDLDLYGETVALEFFERLRPTERFDSIGELVHQMADDVARARRLLSVVT